MWATGTTRTTFCQENNQSEKRNEKWAQNCLYNANQTKKCVDSKNGTGEKTQKTEIVFPLFSIQTLYCPAVFGHFSPAPVKTDRAVRIQ